MQAFKYTLRAIGLIVLGTFVLTVGGALILPVDAAASVVLAWLALSPIGAVAYPIYKRRGRATRDTERANKEIEGGK